MQTIHMTEAEALRDFASALASARAGIEVVIDSSSTTPLVLHQATEGRVRSLSEMLQMAKTAGYEGTLDSTFGADLETAIKSHPEPSTHVWE